MNEMIDKIAARKKEINELCMELRWVYRGYFTQLNRYLSQRSFCSSAENLCDRLIAYDTEIPENERNLYKQFLLSSIFFLRKYCRSADMIFLSIYKIALVVEQAWNQGNKFNNSTYYYMFEPHERESDTSREYAILKESFSAFGELYDDTTIDKRDFVDHIVLMIDCLLFESNQCFLLDSNYEKGIDHLKGQIVGAKHRLQSSLREDLSDES